MYMAMLMSELQYASSGHQVYYHFSKAYGLTGEVEHGRQLLLYLWTEEQVREALTNGRQSRRPAVNKILDRERALVSKGNSQ